MPLTPLTSKGILRTPKIVDQDKKCKGGTSSVKRQSCSRVKKSLDGNGNTKNTPVSTNIAISFNTPNRKSSGNIHRNNMASINPETNSLKKADCFIDKLNGIELEKRDDESSSTVSVGVRVRPINERELKDPKIKNIIDMGSREVIVNCENGGVLSFTYDHCFWSCDSAHENYASQEQVYQCMAKPLLDHAYEGYNVCLFAYGQTGSGKSYCMMGEENFGSAVIQSDGLLESAGIIPRFCRDLFAEADKIHCANNENIQCKVVMEISYIEIYNEKIYDLIGRVNAISEEEQQHSTNIPVGADKREPLRIREHPQDGPYVVGASCHLVSCYKDLEIWIALGNKQRSIASTGMNDKSSRSHSVFSVKVTQTQSEIIQEELMEHSLVSVINLVDLAGSERVAASQLEEGRLKEGVCINKSLLTLGKVITALAESNGKRRTFVPYRESSLTWLLKESLGGNSKTTMIATISPCSIHQEETLSTLRYAQQAQKIINWNRINEDQTSKIIRALKLEVERLRSLQVCSPKFSSLGEITLRDMEEDKSVEAIQRNEENCFENQKVIEREIILAKENEIAQLKEKLHAAQEQFTERARLWEDKLLEAEVRKKEALERCRMKGLALKMEGNAPTLISLSEDPQVSQSLLYSLKYGSTTLGTANSDVILSGLLDADIHCSIFYEEEKLVLHPSNKTETFVNGKLVKTPTQIFHNDRIVLGGIYFFRLCFCSSNKENINSLKDDMNNYDFFFAKDELLKEQEERIRNELTVQQARARAEMLKELEERKLELQLQEVALKENYQTLSSELEEERHMNEETEMARFLLEEEKHYLEDQVKLYQRLNSLSSSDPLSYCSSPELDTSFFQNMEAIFNESAQVLESSEPEIQKDDINMWFLISEANSICMKIGKPYVFQQQSRLTMQGIQNVIIVRDEEHNLSAPLDADEFKKAVSILRDLLLGEEDNNVLETYIAWERRENLSTITPIQNRIRENRRLSINRTLNSSVVTSDFSINSSIKENGLSKSVCRSLSEQNAKTLSRNSYSNPTIVVARAASQVLLSLVSPSTSNHIFMECICNIIEFLTVLKEFMSNYQQSIDLSSDDYLSQNMVEITIKVKVIDYSILRLSSEFIPSLPENVYDVKTQFSTFGIKLVRKVARMFQGIEKDVKSLVEEECNSIHIIIYHLLEELGFLNLVSSIDLVEAPSLISCLIACQKYLMGVSRGLEWSVKNATKTAEMTVSILLTPLDKLSHHSSRERLFSVTHRAVSRISDFLTEFSQLKVIPEVEPRMSQKNAIKEATRFLSRVTSAAKNTRDLISCFGVISKQIREIQDGLNEVNVLEEEIVKLQEALSELVNDAGIGSTYEKKSRLYSDTNVGSVASFMERLHSSAVKAFKEIEKMKDALTLYSESQKLKWTRDTSATLNFTYDDAFSNYPVKSSLKSKVGSMEEKKVRFKDTSTSILSRNEMEDGYDVVSV